MGDTPMVTRVEQLMLHEVVVDLVMCGHFGQFTNLDYGADRSEVVEVSFVPLLLPWSHGLLFPKCGVVSRHEGQVDEVQEGVLEHRSYGLQHGTVDLIARETLSRLYSLQELIKF